METIKLDATKREVRGKKVKAMRRAGKLPAVIYGRGVKEPVSISLDRHESSKILREVSPSTIVTVNVDGEEFTTLVRSRQRDYIRGEYTHIDFLAISLTEKVRTNVSLSLEGDAPAAKDGGVLITGIDRIEVEALPGDLPEYIVIDLSVLKEIGDGIYVKDVAWPSGVECLADDEEMIAVVTFEDTSIEEEEAEEMEGDIDEGSEPEVIGKGKDEDDEEDE